MRSPLRSSAIACTCLATVLSLGVAAYADEAPVPSSQRLADARAQVQRTTQDVASIQAELEAAKARLGATQLAASIASEEYNGAMWRLSESRKASQVAEQRATRLRDRVAAQRDGMARLVVQSYQEGTQLNSMTALLEADGPESIMGRQAVVDMAGDSIDADLQHFKVLGAAAERAQDKAERAALSQERLAAEARVARDAAAGAVASAAALEGEIAQQRDALVAELARSQDISLELARERQSALEAVAQQKADAADRAVAAAAAESSDRVERDQVDRGRADRDRAERDRQAAEQAAAQAAADVREVRESRDAPAPAPAAPAPPPEPAGPAPAPSGGADAAIAFARAQIGEPYRWGAAGPDSWDCSGLTMMAWAKGGKSLPHYSVAQYSAGTRIPLSSVRPGDLYFWSSNGRPSGIHHVALAIGGGRFIEAPRTGVDVRENHVGNWFPSFAVRL